MRTLLVLRHAKSSWKDSSLADHDRPLKKRGKRDAPRMGRLMAGLGLEPDLAICSPALRARATLEAVAETAPLECPIEHDRDLYMAGPREIAGIIRAVPEGVGCLLLVGHNPGMEEFVEAVTGEPTAMPTAALARIDLDVDGWSDLPLDGSARLAGFWTPKQDLR